MDQRLDQIQRWMQTVITHPAGVEAGLETAAQQQPPVAPADVEQIINPSRQMTSNQRLAVYANAYYARLIECLTADFPIFRQTVGDDAFTGFAIGYLQQHPSQSYTLGQLGAQFADYLAATRPAAELPTAGDQAVAAADWADFLIDLACLERTLSEVFDGPGVERQPTISAGELSAIDPQQWSDLQLVVAPCVRLLSLRFPLNGYYTALKNGESLAPPAAQPSWLAITRRDYVVRRYELTEPQFRLLAALANGQALGQALAQAAAIYPGEIEEFAADVHRWFRVWIAAPLFLKATSN